MENEEQNRKESNKCKLCIFCKFCIYMYMKMYIYIYINMYIPLSEGCFSDVRDHLGPKIPNNVKKIVKKMVST